MASTIFYFVALSYLLCVEELSVALTVLEYEEGDFIKTVSAAVF